jgi:hypothetical protein
LAACQEITVAIADKSKSKVHPREVDKVPEDVISFIPTHAHFYIL